MTAAEPDARRGWFPADAERHRRDAPRYCPACATPLALADGGQGLATEYWTGPDRVFVCFCGACGWTGDIVLAARVTGHEATPVTSHEAARITSHEAARITGHEAARITGHETAG